jgi:hypothetical protein
MNIKKLAFMAPAVGIGAVLLASEASAGNVTLTGNQEILTFGGQVNATNINTFFDGGSDAYGTAGGAANNVGVTFSAPAEFLNAGFNGTGFNGGTGKFENVPSAATGVLYFASVPTTSSAIMDDASGFSGISFNYSILNNSASDNSTVSLYSGLDGTGNLLATLTLSAAGTTVACTSSHDEFCTWSSVGNANIGGIAESAVFNGAARTFTEFDAVALTATPVPLPAALWLMLGGIGGLARFVRRRSAKAAA